MKTAILIFAFCICFNAYAQQKEPQLEVALHLNNSQGYGEPNLDYSPIYNRWSKTINKSFSMGGAVSYAYNKDRFFRIKFGFTNLNFKVTTDTFFILHYTDKQKLVNITPGILWKTNLNKLNFYGGFEFPFIIIGERIIGDEFYTDILPGGFSVGPGVSSGFNVKLWKNLYVGGEVSFACLYTRLGGNSLAQGNPEPNEYPFLYQSVDVSKLVTTLNLSYKF